MTTRFLLMIVLVLPWAAWCQFETSSYPKPILDGQAFIEKDAAGQYGVIDAHGNVLIPFLYNRIQENDLGLFVFKINKSNGLERSYSLGYYNKRLQLILPVAFHSLLAIDHGRIIAGKNEDRLFGIVDTLGKEIIPFNYQELYAPQEGVFLAKKNSKYGFINQKNNVVIDFQFTYAGSFSEGKATASTSTLIGYINKQGNFIIPMRFSAADEFKHGYAQVFFNDDASILTSQGNVLFPFVFSHIECIGNNQFIFESMQLNRSDFESTLKSSAIAASIEEQDSRPSEHNEEAEVEAYNDANYFHGILTPEGNLIGGSHFSQVLFLGTFNEQNYFAVQSIEETDEGVNYNFAIFKGNGEFETSYRFIEVMFDENGEHPVLVEEIGDEMKKFQLNKQGKLVGLTQ